MRPITVTAGPLAASSATKVATVQRNYAAGALALIGAASNTTSTSVCASQAPGSSAFTINGTRATSGVAYLPSQYVYITSSGDDHGISFTVVGLSGPNLIRVSESVHGTNAQSSATVNTYNQILSIAPSGAVAANVTVGSYTKATLDTQRRLLFTTTADESANVATIAGTDISGTHINESLTLTNNSTNYTVLDYYTVNSVTMSAAAAGNISVGTNGVSSSPWVKFDDFAPSNISIQCNVSGTANYTVQSTLDNPNSATNPVAVGSVTWINTSDPAVVAASSNQQSNFLFAPSFARILLNSSSGSGAVTATFLQSSNGPI